MISGSSNTNNGIQNPGGLSNFQNSLPSVGNMGASMNSHNGLGNAPMSASSGDTLSQAYTGIQQYAGLSGLLGQGKDLFSIFFRPVDVMCCVTLRDVMVLPFALCSHSTGALPHPYFFMSLVCV